MPNLRTMTDVEVCQYYRMYDSRPRSPSNMSVNDQNRSIFKQEMDRRRIDTYSTTSDGLGYVGNVGHIRYKDGSVWENRKRR